MHLFPITMDIGKQCRPDQTPKNVTYDQDFHSLNTGMADISNQFRKIIVRYKRIGYNINVMRQLHA